MAGDKSPKCAKSNRVLLTPGRLLCGAGSGAASGGTNRALGENLLGLHAIRSPGGDHPRAGGEYRETRGEFPRPLDRRGAGGATRYRPVLDPYTATWEATRKPRVSERTLANLQAGCRRLQRGQMASVMRKARVSGPAARTKLKAYPPGLSRRRPHPTVLRCSTTS